MTDPTIPDPIDTLLAHLEALEADMRLFSDVSRVPEIRWYDGGHAAGLGQAAILTVQHLRGVEARDAYIAARPERTDPTRCSGDEGFCPEHGFHRHSLKQRAESGDLELGDPEFKLRAGSLDTETPATDTDRLAQSGVDTPDCDCGHADMGEGWHRRDCVWREGRTTPDNPVASSVALENTDICDSYAPPTEPSESGICARCGMCDWKHISELARLRAEPPRMREAGDHHLDATNQLRAVVADGCPVVQGRCPACGLAGLFLGSGGYVTCRSLDCPQPDAATEVIADFWAARQHGGFTFCAQSVGHVTMTAFAKKITEKVTAVAQRKEAVGFANDQKERAGRAEAALTRVRAVVDRIKVGAPWAANQADIAARLHAALDGDPS